MNEVIMTFVGIIAVIVSVPVVTALTIAYRNKLSHEKRMKPCPVCGHRAITMYYTGENNPHFFTAECGAYVRRGSDRIYNHQHRAVSPNGYFNGLPPMNGKQIGCSFCAGYDADVPQFMTRLGAVKWWNRVACSEKYVKTYLENKKA